MFMSGKILWQRSCSKLILFCLCAFCLLTGTAAAHVEQWADPGYNFKGVQKMLVYDFDMSAVKMDSDIAEKNFKSVFGTVIRHYPILYLLYWV